VRERTLRSEKLSGNIQCLTSHNNDFLAIKQLLCDSTGQTTKQVSFAVDDDLKEEKVLVRSVFRKAITDMTAMSDDKRVDSRHSRRKTS
jgi:hypothetical protein